MLRGEGAIGWNPIYLFVLFYLVSIFTSIHGTKHLVIPFFGIMGFAQRIAGASMAGGKDSIPRASESRGIQLNIHQLVHILEDEHVTVQLHDAVELNEREGRELGPAVVEARIVGVVLGD